MNEPRGLTRRTVDGLLGLLADAGIGRVAHQDAIFTEDDTALVPKFMPDYPNRAVVIHIYDRDTEVDPSNPRRVLYMQVRARAEKADPQSVDDTMDDIAALLGGKHAFYAGGVYLDRCTHLNSASLGVDTQGRQERADNYSLLLQVGQPTKESETP